MIPQIDVTIMDEGVLLECKCPQNGYLATKTDDFELGYLIKAGYEEAIKEGYTLLKKYQFKDLSGKLEL